MFIENNLRKKKPEGTFTDPDKQEAKEVTFIDETPITPPKVYEQIVPPQVYEQFRKKTPVKSPITLNYTKGGFGAIR